MEDNAIIVKDLVKKFGSFTAVDAISFTVKKGETFAFLGPNGAGKTTTIKMLTTLLTPTSGNITLNGFDVTRQQDNARKSFGIVFQDPSLDDELTAYENMEFHAVLFDIPKQIREKRIQELLEFVELWNRKDSLIKTFSGGMKRRLEIARGLLHNPAVLFLDEPTIGLDPQTRNLVWTHIRDLNTKKHVTVFLTTHYMEEAEKMANTIAVIDHGKLIAQGTAKDLKTKTKTTSLEDAFLALTGTTIRDEDASSTDRLRVHRQMRGH